MSYMYRFAGAFFLAGLVVLAPAARVTADEGQPVAASVVAQVIDWGTALWEAIGTTLGDPVPDGEPPEPVEEAEPEIAASPFIDPRG